MEGGGFDTTSTSTSSGGGGERNNQSTVVSLPTLDIAKTAKINSTTMTSSSSSSLKKSGASGGRRSMQKRVVSVPIAEVDGSRPKGAGEGAPPSDSWTWRKYGQKPIKGSPYPRGYYRCSSCKGCPARKQVERSRVDPTMLVVTYAAEHNHPWPLAKSHNHQNHQHRHSGQSPRLPPPKTTQFRQPREPEGDGDEEEEEEEEEEQQQLPSPTPETTTNTSTSSLEDTNTTAATFVSDLGEDSSPMMLMAEDLGWHSYMSEVSLSSEVAMMMPVSYDDVSKDLGFGSGGGGGGGEEESLFAGLGELPECSVVFRRGFSVGAS